jgi:CRP/FNR family transcriptional regulator, cyclic AMP receptor protein
MATNMLFRRAEEYVEFYEPGQVIFEEGQAGDLMYAVVEGEVDIIHNDKVLFSISAGGIFGEMALIDNSPRSATAQAKTQCKLVPVNEKRFLYLVQETPFFALQVMRSMANRLRILGDAATMK